MYHATTICQKPLIHHFGNITQANTVFTDMQCYHHISKSGSSICICVLDITFYSNLTGFKHHSKYIQDPLSGYAKNSRF